MTVGEPAAANSTTKDTSNKRDSAAKMPPSNDDHERPDTQGVPGRF
jgi:hypothetical protein